MSTPTPVIILAIPLKTRIVHLYIKSIQSTPFETFVMSKSKDLEIKKLKKFVLMLDYLSTQYLKCFYRDLRKYINYMHKDRDQKTR